MSAWHHYRELFTAESAEIAKKSGAKNYGFVSNAERHAWSLLRDLCGLCCA